MSDNNRKTTFTTDEERQSGPNLGSTQRPSLVPTSEEFSVTNSYIKRYTRIFRAADAAMIKLFDDVDVLTPSGQLVKVPIIYGTAERAVMAIVGSTMQEDGNVRRVKLPMMSIYSMGQDFDYGRYTYHQARHYGHFPMRSEKKPNDVVLGMSRGIPVNRQYVLGVWTKFVEDANQIIEQIQLKFSPFAYLRIAGSPWENIATFDGLANNLNVDVADQDLRVIKYEIMMTLQTYAPQPIKRTKTLHKTKVDYEVEPKGDSSENYLNIESEQSEIPKDY